MPIPASKIGQIFKFAVSAVNEIGEGQPSDPTNIIAGDLPSPPLNLTKVSADAN